MDGVEEVIHELETNRALYARLGWRERRILALLASCGSYPTAIKRTTYGTVVVATPAGTFELAWNVPGYAKGTVVG